MITIKKICNYKENTRPSQPTAVLYYIDFVTEDEDLYNREIKRRNRELAIDITLGEKDESEWEDRQPIEINEDKDSIYTNTVGPKIMSVNVSASTFTGTKDLELDILLYLENLTKNAPIIKNGMGSFDVNYDNTQSNDYNQRRVISKIVSLGNLIAMDSRIGIANTAIIGSNINIDIAMNGDKMGNFDIVRSSVIDPNKIIVMKNSTDIGAGLNVMNNINDGTYFMIETQNW